MPPLRKAEANHTTHAMPPLRKAEADHTTVEEDKVKLVVHTVVDERLPC